MVWLIRVFHVCLFLIEQQKTYPNYVFYTEVFLSTHLFTLYIVKEHIALSKKKVIFSDVITMLEIHRIMAGCNHIFACPITIFKLPTIKRNVHLQTIYC